MFSNCSREVLIQLYGHFGRCSLWCCWGVLPFTEKHLNTTQFNSPKNFKMLIKLNRHLSKTVSTMYTHFKITVFFTRLYKTNPYSNIILIYFSLNLAWTFQGVYELHRLTLTWIFCVIKASLLATGFLQETQTWDKFVKVKLRLTLSEFIWNMFSNMTGEKKGVGESSCALLCKNNST